MKPALPCPARRFDAALQRVRSARVTETCGRVVQVIGLVIESEGPVAAVGEICRIESARHDGITLAEVVGFRNHHLLLMPLGELKGIHPGSEVTATGAPMRIGVGHALQGRVLDGLGRPIDGLGTVQTEQSVELNLLPPHPLKRQRIQKVFQTGIKTIDTFMPCGRGAGRGREVREFLERDLDAAGRKKSVVIVATSNEPALHRVKGAFLAMAIGEYFRNLGLGVLLMMDSVTRLAMAQREIGLAVGEPPTTRGYTPSVFSLLPQLLERAGTGETGDITGLFTVLVEADDMNDPIADATRSILDGHIVLTRELATQNHYPAIDVLESVSRLNRDLLSPEQITLTAAAREHLAVFRRNQDLIAIGAYPAGSNPVIDQAIALHEPLKRFMSQGVTEGFGSAQSWSLLSQTLAKPVPQKQPQPRK
jgi:flagellum-specific ATP synthase